MLNVHPIYGLKNLLIRRELDKDEKMKNASWAKMLPNFKKQNLKRSKRKHIRRNAKLEASPFPPAPAKRKEDVLMETGEYFLKKKKRERSEGGDEKSGKKAKTDKKEKKSKKDKADEA